LRGRATQEATSSLEFLDRELAKASTVEIRSAMFQLVEAQKKQQMLATVREDYIFRIIDPAVAADQDRFVKPKRALIAAACGFAGGILGIAVVLYRNRRYSKANDKK
jgi:LPS O-antigen subunit length determinant protein (WzzB/FepE family)